jgi:hypothetical protein
VSWSNVQAARATGESASPYSVWGNPISRAWRPSTAINLADTDGNPATDPDPSWAPLRPNPA